MYQQWLHCSHPLPGFHVHIELRRTKRLNSRQEVPKAVHWDASEAKTPFTAKVLLHLSRFRDYLD